MPFNLLLVPLVAGFLFISKAHLFAYSTSLLEKEQLVLRASIAGLMLAIASRLCCWGIVRLPFGDAVEQALYALAPFPFIGTALGSLVLSYASRRFVNFLVPEAVAGDWLYHGQHLNQMESMLLRSSFGIAPSYAAEKRRLLWRRGCFIVDFVRSRDRSARSKPIAYRLVRAARSVRIARKRSPYPFGDPQAVMITLRDRRVYVGYIMELPPVTGRDLQFVRMLPVWSGYRRSESHEVVQITSYKEAVANAQDSTTLVKVFPCCVITSANLFEDELFEIQNTTAEKPKRLSLRSSTRPRNPKRNRRGRTKSSPNPDV